MLCRHQCCGDAIFITCLPALKATSIDHLHEDRSITQTGLADGSVVYRYLSLNLPNGSRTNTTIIGVDPATLGQRASYVNTLKARLTPYAVALTVRQTHVPP